MDEIFDKTESESAYLGITYGGDALRTIANNTNLNFAIPIEGGNAFVECIAIHLIKSILIILFIKHFV